MKSKKRRIALALALCLLASCLAPLGAAAVGKDAVRGFSDIADSETAVSAEVLRMMGALDGYGDGSFRPDVQLTRAQFCKIAVLVMNQGDQVAQYKNYTIFPDVKSSHWAAGYINLAVRGPQKSAQSTEEGKPQPGRAGIISGFADGTFGPERSVTYAQAVTILVRMLGHTDQDVGGVWPDSYFSVAATSGLTDGIQAENHTVVTRGLAARLFANLLATNTKGSSTSFGASVADTAVTGQVLLNSNATAADGTKNSLLLSNGTTYKTAVNPGTGALNGRKGTLLLDSGGNALTFVPDKAGKTATIVVALAKADCLVDNQGQRYDVNGKAATYCNGKLDVYSEQYTYLTGSRVTLSYNTAGQVEYVFSGGENSTEAIVVADKGSVAGFEFLAGGYNYAIYKNGLEATSGDLRKYDVAVYSSMQNAILVTDTKLVGVLEDVYPNLRTPSTVTVMGHKFDVLPSAGPDFDAFKAGDPICLLLTSDNKVAGAVPPSGQTRSNAIGLVSEISASSVTVTLLNGLELKGNPGLGEDAANMKGQLVKVASDRKGMLYLTRLVGGNSYPNLDLTTRKLGQRSIADNVLVYEQTGDGELNAVSLNSLPQTTVGGGRIVYAGYDWANRVNLLIFSDVSGDGYLYGRVSYVAGESNDDENGNSHSSAGTFTLEYGSGKKKSVTTNSSFESGTYAGVSFSADGTKITGFRQLSELKNVPNSAWSGSLVNVGGVTYPISSDVLCYNRATHQWVTVGAARAWSDRANLYYDRSPAEGGRIRIIEVS